MKKTWSTLYLNRGSREASTRIGESPPPGCRTESAVTSLPFAETLFADAGRKAGVRKLADHLGHVIVVNGISLGRIERIQFKDDGFVALRRDFKVDALDLLCGGRLCLGCRRWRIFFPCLLCFFRRFLFFCFFFRRHRRCYGGLHFFAFPAR